MNFGYRHYDVQLSRWNVTDPANQYHSPYIYCGNNPVNKIDPDGTTVVNAWIRDMVNFIRDKRDRELTAAWLARANAPTYWIQGSWKHLGSWEEYIAGDNSSTLEALAVQEALEAQKALEAANKEAEEADQEFHPISALGTNGERLVYCLIAQILLSAEENITTEDLGELDPDNIFDQGELVGIIGGLVALDNISDQVDAFTGKVENLDLEEVTYDIELVEAFYSRINNGLLKKAVDSSTLKIASTSEAVKGAIIIMSFKRSAFGPLIPVVIAMDNLKSVNDLFKNRPEEMKPLIEAINYIDDFGVELWEYKFRDDYKKRLYKRNRVNFGGEIE